MQTLAEILASQARHFAQNTFLICEDRQWSYETYFDTVCKLADVLRSRGVSKGQPVCLYLPSRPELAFAYHACQLIGAIATPMSGMYRAAEISKIVNRTAACVLVTDTERAQHVRAVEKTLPSLQHVLVFGGDDVSPPLEDELASSARATGNDRVGPEDVAALFFTSGTTGEPKGAMQNQRNVMAALRGGEVYTACTAGKEVFLGVLPLFNNFGSTVVLNGALYNGGTLVLHERWDVERIITDIGRYKVSVFFGTPTMFKLLLNIYDPTRHDLSSLRLCLAGGAVLVPSLIKDFEQRIGTRLINIYGATEVSTYVTAEPLLGPRMDGAVGLPIGNTALSILDGEGKPLPRGETGEIGISGDTVGPGYWQDPETTAQVFRNGVWLSGDIGFIDELDQLHVIDRKKDVIISGGFNIYPIEVEDVLYRHEDVALCALIGVPDDEKGELPVAYIVPATGRSPRADDLIAYCRANLAAYKAPRRIIFKDVLPLGPTGKILKKELRGLFAGEQKS